MQKEDLSLRNYFLAAVCAAQTVAIAAFADEASIPLGEDGLLTDWSTSLIDGVDLGWQGAWVLESATVVVPNGTVQFPSAGHVLTIDYLGNYTLDYSTAYFLGAIQVHTGVFSGSMATVPPPGLMPSGVPENCATTGQFSGLVSGRLFAPFDVDLDRQDDDGVAIYGLPWMEAALNPAASQMPSVTCPGAEVSVQSTGTVMPLGAGRPTLTANGQVVPYDYAIDEDLTTLMIDGRGMPRIIYIFRKASE